MKIFVDYAKKKIAKVEKETDLYFGNNNVDKVTVLFASDVDMSTFYVSLSAKCSNGRDVLPRLSDAVEDGQSTTISIGGVTYKFVDFTLSSDNGWMLSEGLTCFYVWLNTENSNQCVGSVRCNILGATNGYLVDNPIVNPQLREYLNNEFDTFREDFNDEYTEEVNAQRSLINNFVGGQPRYVNTSSNILALTTNKGVAVGTDTGHWYYWDGTQYVDSGKVYQTTEGVIKNNGKQLLDKNGANLYPNVLVDNLPEGKTLTTHNSTEFNKNANEVAANTIISITSSGWSNLPGSYTNGVLLTFSGNNASTLIQSFIPSTTPKIIYYRAKWGSDYSSWTSIANATDVENLNASISECLREYATTNYRDLDNAPRNSSITYTSVSGVTNTPINETGTLLTFSGINDSTKTQIYVTNNNVMYFRKKWVNWTDWKKVVDTNVLNEELAKKSYNDILPMYSGLTFIGDSLTYSTVYTSSTTSRQARKTYPQIVSQLSGVPQETFAFGGATPTAWWNNYNQNLTPKTNQLYIVYLGTNNGLTDTIDTDCPEGSISGYANTETGNYGKILRTIYDNGSKAILIKVYATNGNVETTNNVIEQFGEKFGFPVIDNKKFTDNCYHYYPDKSGANSLHYNDLGYSVFANYVINQIGLLSSDMLERLVN